MRSARGRCMHTENLLMTMKRPLAVLFMVLALACSRPASAQLVTTIPELTLRQTLSTLTGLAGPSTGEALGMATSLEIGTAPFGTSSGGFVTKLDPSTGLQVRTATTFGPSFTERALTSGEGKVSMGATFYSANFDRLNDLRLTDLRLGGVTGAASRPDLTRTGLTTLNISAKTLVLSSVIGVTENLDIGVAIPMVTVEVNGSSTFTNGSGVVAVATKGGGIAKGLGDIGAQVKYRFMKFGEGLPDPGGIALLASVRLPTGEKENLRGLGVTRTMLSGVYSSGKGRFRPHATGGYEFWSKSVDAVTDFATGSTVQARHQYQYGAGIEVEATPKLTLITDIVGRQILGAGKLGFRSTPSSQAGVSSVESTVVLPDGIRKLVLVPGLKLNLKAKMLLSLNALVSLRDNGLHARFTPVIGIDLTL
jgi:hypothetical protein